MMKRFKLEFELVVDEAMEGQLIENARRLYRDSGGITEVLENGSSRRIPASEHIDGTPAALLHLGEINPLLQGSGIEFTDVSGTDLGYVEEEPAEEEVVQEEEVVEEGGETGVYLYRWPNGGFSIVQAGNRDDA